MGTIKRFLSGWGIHIVLLPVFFVLHNYLQYYGLVSMEIALKTLAEILGIVLLFFVLLLAFTRNAERSFQITTLVSFAVLFYGVVKDFIGKSARLPFVASYTVLLPLFILLVIVLCIVIFKSNNFSRMNFFENLLLLLFILADLVSAFVAQNGFNAQRNMLGNKYSLPDYPVKPAVKPDVYFLLFDSYPGTAFLRNYLQYNNDTMDSALSKRGFRVIADPKSNYNRTAFSMASELNFAYLKGIDNATRLRAIHYNQALYTLRNAAVPEVFMKLGYKVYNLSVFELAGQQPLYKESFLTRSPQRILLFNTFIERFRNDLAWHFTGKHARGIFRKFGEVNEAAVFEEEIKKKEFTAKVVDSAGRIPQEKTIQPKFVYAHIYMPHPPYFYDENGNSNPTGIVLDKQSYFNRKMFLSYLKYSNKVMTALIDKIVSGSPVPPVIIVQSDHSSTDYEGVPDIPALCFKNYTAFYFPDKQYNSIYDTLSNINTFPVLFNKYFNTQIPLQKDTATFLRY